MSETREERAAASEPAAASEMVDRVVRALTNGFRRDSSFVDLARAAISAMREPTEAMLDAGDSMMPQIEKGQDILTGYDALKDAWPAMIDAALSHAPASSNGSPSASEASAK